MVYTPPKGYGPHNQPNQQIPQINAGITQSADYQNLQNVWQSLLPSYLPGIIGNQNQYNTLAGQIPTSEALFGQQAGYQQTQEQQQLEQLGLQGQQLGIQQGALARQFQLDPALYGLQQAGFGLQQQAIQQQLGIAPQQYQLEKQNITSQGVAGGSLFTSGQKQEQKGAKLAFDEQMQQLRDQYEQLGLTRQGAALSFNEQMAQLRDSQKNLGILQQQLGLSGQEITTRTQQALNQLGIGQMVTVDQIHQAMIDAQNGITNPLTQLLGQVYSLSGIRPVASSGG